MPTRRVPLPVGVSLPSGIAERGFIPTESYPAGTRSHQTQETGFLLKLVRIYLIPHQ
ncbi:hypothetical protein [Brunnivagina elsteri]|uniref:hypothetical protein n=1 Tax=Brunnivagina elsteri TaxID=1247191 RepID=UPI00130430E3|nr:hypothetical protein [Calothrix elsteri]